MEYTPQDLFTIAEEVIRNNRFITLATAGNNGHPWIAPLMYAVDKNNRFYWVSGHEAVHSKHIAQNPSAAIVIFDSDPEYGKAQALYGSGTAEELSGDELALGCDVFYRMRFPDDVEREAKGRKPTVFKGDSPRRMYRITVTEFSILHPSKQHPKYGSLVDYRVVIDFNTSRIGIL
jgi:nitroimidazol reductase NimA-like FMN-containing flavoprotein (pyridoxamine 5'-phosphate oxidase superfamily)